MDDGSEFLIKKCLSNRRSITFSDNKYKLTADT